MPNQLLHHSSTPGVTRGGDEMAVLAAIAEYGYGKKFLNTDIYAKLPKVDKAFILGTLTALCHKGSLGWMRLKFGVHEYWRVEPPTVRRPEK